ncbi:MAG: hypothetical protein KBB83_04740 [Alphaproteobacteria bacterium]|nr:hypothetical protein [Alphaproteobacteria bacterium]
MLIDKAIRKKQLMGRSLGYSEVDSAEIFDRAELELNPREIMPSFVEDLQNWPEKIEILCQWQQRPINLQGVMVQEIVNGHEALPVNFYEMDQELAVCSQFNGIDLVYKDVCQILHDGQWMDLPSAYQLGVSGEQSFYEKAYPSQSPGLFKQERVKASNSRWHVSLPAAGLSGEDMVPLLAYGCYAPKGGDFSLIEPVYASIRNNGKQTTLNLMKESTLRRAGIQKPGGGVTEGWRYQFAETALQDSPIMDILGHKIRMTIKTGEEAKNYISFSYKNSSVKEQLIYLTMIPE